LFFPNCRWIEIYRHPKGQFEQWKNDRWGRVRNDGDTTKVELDFYIDQFDDSGCGHNIFCLVKAVGKLYGTWLNWLNALKLYMCA
jgi:hypothetical protein